MSPHGGQCSIFPGSFLVRAEFIPVPMLCRVVVLSASSCLLLRSPVSFVYLQCAYRRPFFKNMFISKQRVEESMLGAFRRMNGLGGWSSSVDVFRPLHSQGFPGHTYYSPELSLLVADGVHNRFLWELFFPTSG